jgi:tartrate dehydrogenase/decarboxylase/D-malate dehydrogenase
MGAIESALAAGVLTPDLGGTATTRDVTRAVIDALARRNAPGSA